MRLVVFITIAILPGNLWGQKTVFDLARKDATLAEQYYFKGDLYAARALYQRSSAIKPEVRFKMLGRCTYQLRDYVACADAYQKLTGTTAKWQAQDYLNYAEALVTLKKYETASEIYRKVLDLPDYADWIEGKLWRLGNMKYLYEDSVHLAVRRLKINTEFAEWGGRTIQGKLVFLSNRPTGDAIRIRDAATNMNFYHYYQSNEVIDTLVDGWGRLFQSPGKFSVELPKGNAGGFCFYQNYTKLVFTANTGRKDRYGIVTLGIFFAELQNGRWIQTGEFEYNSATWSVTNPWIDETGQTLYFASNSREGFGGYDLYVSNLNNSWSKPVNLGAAINSPWDEQFPWVSAGKLYFASNGHSGLGGLDLFSTELRAPAEPVNLGYPINSEFDDFGITFTDSLATHGFLSSNRQHGGLDDDLYEFDMDLQTYPFTITGILKQQEHAQSDTANVRVLQQAKIVLKDNARGIEVLQTTSDAAGYFTLTIPYFAKYTLQVIDSDEVEHVAAFDLPRQRTKSTVHEIVLVKDIFQTFTR
ncbi:MAG: tetratricopeptide repeat protein [Cytophagales bacterium]|nr:tetratricopeptide repeat protein [Cytophagales bacterium]